MLPKALLQVQNVFMAFLQPLPTFTFSKCELHWTSTLLQLSMCQIYPLTVLGTRWSSALFTMLSFVVWLNVPSTSIKHANTIPLFFIPFFPKEIVSTRAVSTNLPEACCQSCREYTLLALIYVQSGLFGLILIGTLMAEENIC